MVTQLDALLGTLLTIYTGLDSESPWRDNSKHINENSSLNISYQTGMGVATLVKLP